MELKTLDNIHFVVILSNTNFKVSFSDKYYDLLVKKLGSRLLKEEIIEASFNFLLDRESKNQILREFNIEIIKNYFPEFENKVKDYL